MPRALRMGWLVWTLACALVCASAAPALADGPAGHDPTANFPLGSLPASCSQPTSAGCLDASVAYLNQARASLGQPAYALPSNFDSLTAPEQAFVLTDLDRVLYSLTPMPGLVASLNQDAAAGVQADGDPRPSDSAFSYWTSNWASGFLNMPLAYAAWMYDDGPGSGNIDCTAAHMSGCWGHRHDILWDFGAATGSFGMGAASGTDSGGTAGYAMLLGEGDPGWTPTYSYTWAQAVAAGANHSHLAGSGSGSGSSAGSGSGSSPGSGSAHRAKPPTGHAARVTIRRFTVRRHRVAVTLAAPSRAALICSLSRRGRHGYRVIRHRRCGARITFGRLRRGRYRLRVIGATGSATRYFRIH